MTTLQPSNGAASPSQIPEPSSPASSGAQLPWNLRSLLQEMANVNASDLHLVAGRPPMLRANGSLFPMVKMVALSPGETETLFLVVAGSEESFQIGRAHV